VTKKRDPNSTSEAEFEALVEAALRVNPKGLSGKHAGRKSAASGATRPGKIKKVE
jgi:hypothetical protein